MRSLTALVAACIGLNRDETDYGMRYRANCIGDALQMLQLLPLLLRVTRKTFHTLDFLRPCLMFSANIEQSKNLSIPLSIPY